MSSGAARVDRRETSPVWVWNGRIPGLDGFRAIAIIIVLFEHAHHTRGFNHPVWNRIAGRIPGLGPDIFFVISGFLITLLMIRESQRRGNVSLTAFYTRRVLRLAPAFICFLITVWILDHLGYITITATDWAHVLTYTVNFQRLPAWEIGHLWSFSIEEQFYMLWPVCFVLLGVRRARRTVAIWLIFAPALRIAVYAFHPTTMGQFEDWTPLRVDPIAAGSLLALCAVSPRFCRLTQTTGRTALVLTVAAVSTIALSLYLSPIVSIFDVSLAVSTESVCIAMIIWLCANHLTGTFGIVFGSKVIAGLGTLSYSIFMWQQLFMDPLNASYLCVWPTNIAVAMVAAVMSYYCIERPFLRLKDSMNQRRQLARSGIAAMPA